MKLLDIYNFVKAYKQISSEYLLLWLCNYSLFDQLCLILLISTQKINKINKVLLTINKKDHNNCNCLDIYNSLDEYFKFHVPSINCIQKCVLPSNTFKSTIELNTCTFQTYQKFKIYENDIILKYNKTILINPTFTNYTFDKIKISERAVTNIHSYIKYNKTRNYNYSLSISDIYFYRKHLIKILPFINIIELHIVYNLANIFNLRYFEKLLPEYWRTFNRNLYEKKILDPINTLLLIYKFHNIEKILLTNTNNISLFKLPNVVKHVSDINLNDANYILQPNYSGYRVNLYKSHRNIILANRHMVRIKLNIDFSKLLLDKNNTFSGEFIIIAFDNITKKWLSSEDLTFIDYWNKKNKYIIKLIILDLFMWNDINLLVISFEKRLQIIKQFLSTINHFGLILESPIKTFNDFQEEYIKIISYSFKHIYFNGVVFRNKYLNYQKILNAKLFEIQRYDIITKYNHNMYLVKPNKLEIVNRTHLPTCILKSNNCKYKINIICYKYNSIEKILNTCIFDTYKFIPYMRIENITLPTITAFMHNQIYVNNILYKWVVISIKFNTFKQNKIQDIIAINIKPDKSMFDCITYQQILSNFE
uniref:Uncharacterized protein n=1 Tax=Faxonius propinquus nudivirus TaxID=3139431 RepID=A0AAU8GE54_9VIRU